MIKNEKAISDMELDMVVGGAAGLILKKNNDGTTDGFLVDDIKKDIVTSGGEVINYKETGSETVYRNIDPNNMVDFLEYVKDIRPDVKVVWSK